MPNHCFIVCLDLDEILLQSEMGKERALAKQFINISGRQLVMLRIDCPRTTVVRISTMDQRFYKEITSICRSLGDVDLVKIRVRGILDVQFKLSEWPNMVKILNGYALNFMISMIIIMILFE